MISGRAGPLALCAVACVRATPPPDLSRDPQALLAQVRAAQARVVRVRGSARVRIRSPQLSGSVTEFVAAEKPDRLRLETLDFFGNPAAILVADGKRFAFYDAREKTYYRGEPTPENISRLLPVVLPADELATILCGSAPLLPGRPISVEARGAQLLLVLAAGDTGQRLAVGPEASIEASRVRRLVAGAAAGAAEVAPAYDLEMSLFRHAGGIRFPGEVALDAPSARAQLKLTWKDDLEVNGPADGALFRLEPPRGARVVELSSGGSVPPGPPPLEPEPAPGPQGAPRGGGMSKDPSRLAIGGPAPVFLESGVPSAKRSGMAPGEPASAATPP